MSGIEKKSVVYANPWIQLVRKDLISGEDYYALESPDYAVVVALTAQGQVPLVRQFRPALEMYTLELPAGLIDPGEDPEQACRRELREETGLRVGPMKRLGTYPVDPGRQSNYQHAFFAVVEDLDPGFQEEEGVEVVWVSVAELYRMFWANQVGHPLPVAAAFLAGYLPPPEFRSL